MTERPLSPAQAVEKLRKAARDSGVQPNDPLAPLVALFIQLVLWLGRWQEHFAAEASTRLRCLHTQADESTAKLAKMVANNNEATEKAIRIAAARAAKMTAEAVLKNASRRTRFLLALPVALAFGLGWAIEHGRAIQSSNQALAEVAALQGALLAQPNDSGLWAEIIRRNNIRAILNTCVQQGGMMTTTGRVCLAPIRIDGPLNMDP